jgi:hypothetical protein
MLPAQIASPERASLFNGVLEALAASAGVLADLLPTAEQVA